MQERKYVSCGCTDPDNTLVVGRLRRGRDCLSEIEFGDATNTTNG